MKSPNSLHDGGPLWGGTIRAFVSDKNPDYFVAAIAAAISLRRKRQTRREPSPIGWPGSFLARAKSRTRRRLSVRNFAASSASTNASGVSGFIVVPRRFNTTVRQRVGIIGDR